MLADKWCVLDASGGKEAIPMTYTELYGMGYMGPAAPGSEELMGFNNPLWFQSNPDTAFEINYCENDTVEFRKLIGNPFNNPTLSTQYIGNSFSFLGFFFAQNQTSCHETHLFKLSSDGSIQKHDESNYFMASVSEIPSGFVATLKLNETNEWQPENLKGYFDSTTIVSDPPPTTNAYLQYMKTLVGANTFPWLVPITCQPYYFPDKAPPPSPPPLPSPLHRRRLSLHPLHLHYRAS